MNTVNLGGIIFEEWPVDLDESYAIAPGGLSGWDESTAGRQAGGDRPTSHGMFDGVMYRTGRAVTLTGTVLARHAGMLREMRDRLTGVGADGKLVRLQVNWGGLVRWADVRVVSARAPEIDETTAEFIVSMTAADPRRYGPAQVFGPATTVTVRHRGNTMAIPTVTVTGSMPSGYKVTGPGGREYVVSQALLAGQTHQIDMRTGWLYRDGVLQRQAVTKAQRFSIPVATDAVVTLVPVSGSGLITVGVADTFM